MRPQRRWGDPSRPTDLGARERAQEERERDALHAAADVRDEIALQLGTPSAAAKSGERSSRCSALFNTNAMQMAHLEGRRSAAIDKFKPSSRCSRSDSWNAQAEHSMTSMLTAATTTESQEATGSPVAANRPGDWRAAEDDPAEPVAEPERLPRGPWKRQGCPGEMQFKAPKAGVRQRSARRVRRGCQGLNLPQESAQKVLDKVAPVLHAQQAQRLEQVRTPHGQRRRRRTRQSAATSWPRTSPSPRRP